VRSPNRLAARAKLHSLEGVDDVSLFGTALHVRGADGAPPGLDARVRAALAGLVQPDEIVAITPSLEDVFVLHSEAYGEA
jgi:hypothetical protein